jgi:hypothetical protein
MGQKRIIALIDPNTGNVTIETQGFTGKQCIEATKEIELTLGTLQARELTSEAYKGDDPKEAYITRNN